MSEPSTYPLAWPAALPRHEGDRRTVGTLASLNRSMADLQDSLQLFASETGLPIARVIVSSNVTLGDPRPEDPGVAVYFDWDGCPRCVAVDEFTTVESNLRAVYSFIERCRLDLRNGGLPIVRAVLHGFRVQRAAEAA